MTTNCHPHHVAVGDGDALSITDVQFDFLPGGALAVPDGDAVIAPANRASELFARRHQPVFFTRDWHPADHCSFVERGGTWPRHCVRETPGAAFASALHPPVSAVVVSKAVARECEEYSTFRARSAEGEEQQAILKRLGIRRLFLCGLATDYCVLNTARDALAAGLAVWILIDAIRAVNVKPGDGDRALTEMVERGALVTATACLR